MICKDCISVVITVPVTIILILVTLVSRGIDCNWCIAGVLDVTMREPLGESFINLRKEIQRRMSLPPFNQVDNGQEVCMCCLLSVPFTHVKPKNLKTKKTKEKQHYVCFLASSTLWYPRRCLRFLNFFSIIPG